MKHTQARTQAHTRARACGAFCSHLQLADVLSQGDLQDLGSVLKCPANDALQSPGDFQWRVLNSSEILGRYRAQYQRGQK